jgi:glycosyltransferase involved in cell wall biosynthesis
MKICLLADAESIHTIRWCKHFFELGHEIHLISFKNNRIDNINVHHVDSGNINVTGGNWRVLFQYGKVKKIIQEIQPDVLHAMYATSYGVIGALSGFHPFVVTPLGTDVLISPQESFIYRVLLRYVFKKADRITSLAPHMGDAMIKLGGTASKIEEIIFGINTEVFNKINRQLSANEFVITNTRNLEPVYNIPHFLKAISVVKSKISNLKVNIIGDGSLRGDLETLALKLGISDVVTFFGKETQTKVVEMLNRSHVSVSVSLSDGNNLSLIEAMACGAYPIGTDILANRQWIKDKINGNLVKINDVNGLADCIMNVYKNFDTIIDAAMRESDKIIAEKGSWKINMQKMELTYKSLIKDVR